MFAFEDFTGGSETWYDWKCTKCGTEFKSNYADGRLAHKCPYCLLKEGWFSTLEKELAEFCELYFNDVIENDKRLLKRNELDIVIPSIKLAIEFNGNFWHSIKNKKSNYHLDKTIKCNEKGYRLIHIWENEWVANKDDIKSKLYKIFKGEEDLTFNDDAITLDRSWYNNINIPNYILNDVIAPKIVKRDGFEVENCGYLVFQRIE